MFLVTVILLICGIVLTYSTPKLLYHVHKHEGWLIYLNSAKIGIYCLVASYIVSEYIFPLFTLIGYSIFSFFKYDQGFDSIIHNWMTNPWPHSAFDIVNSILLEKLPKQSIDEHRLTIYLSSVSITTLFFTYVFSHIHRLFSFHFIRATNEASAVFSSKSYLDDFLLETSINVEYILITLDNEKCYVGLIDEMPLAIQENGVGVEAIKLYIVYSGYRKKTHHNFVMKNDYTRLWNEIAIVDESEDNELDLSLRNLANTASSGIEIAVPVITIQREKIVSISKFDLQFYDDSEDGDEAIDSENSYNYTINFIRP